MKIRKAVIPAAGKGIRFLPITKYQPKEMLPIINKPTLQYSLEAAAGCGVETVLIVSRPHKKVIEEFFGRSFESDPPGDASKVNIRYVYQNEQLGLGHALLTAKDAVGSEPFILFLPDTILEHGEREMRTMVELYQRYHSSIIAVKRIPKDKLDRYGVIDGEKVEDGLYRITGLVEKPPVDKAPSDLAIIGGYVLTPGIFKALKQTSPGKDGEIQLTDALQILLATESVYAYEFKGNCYDAGTPIGWLETQVAIALKDADIGGDFRDYLKNVVHDI